MTLHHVPPVLLLTLSSAAGAVPLAASAGAAAQVAAPLTKASYLEQGNGAAARGDWVELEKIARAWAASEPKSAVARLALAQALYRLGRAAEAIAPARASIAVEDGASARFFLGESLFETGDLPAAERELARAVALDPSQPGPRRGHARALAALGRYADAVAEIERARAALDPSFETDDEVWYWRIAAGWQFPAAALAHHGRGAWFLERGRATDAAREYEEALRKAPSFADCHYHLGYARHLLGNDAVSEEEYRAAIQGYGDAERALAADVRVTLAQQISATRPAEAVALLRDAVAVRGERLALLVLLGDACRGAGDRACAVQSYQKVLASHEQVPPEWSEHAQRSLVELGDAPKTAAEAAPAMTGADVSPRASRRCDHGVALGEQKRTREAIAEFEAALQEAPRFGFCRVNLAIALLEVGDAAGAEGQLRKAVADGTGGLADREEERRWLGDAQFSLAQVIAQRGGSAAEAAAFVRAALPNLEHKPFGQLLLGRYCAAAGDRQCAVEAFQAALRGRDELQPKSVAEAEQYLRGDATK